MNLYPHNQIAVEAVNKAFETKQRAAVVHATGTGKSYIIAKVAENYNKVLIIAPNNFVLGETKKVCHKGCEFRTYASVMYDEDCKCGYDLIVLDEFHRSGAEKWGEGVQSMLEANPNAKVLGTSATHIRYLDNERNMADEMFDGNVVSHLPLKIAIDEGILPTPNYVASLYSFDLTVDIYNKKIEGLNISESSKEEFRHRIKKIASSWSSSHGVPSIIKKHFDKDMKRIIVFCSKVERAASAREMLGRWLASAGYKSIRFYNIDYKNPIVEAEMEDFQKDNYDGLKVAISVNMLNEGIHVPRVDGVIMLRSTVSRIIIEQQIGRCLTADNKYRIPVVLDLVNNMDSISYSWFGFNNAVIGKKSNEVSSKDKEAFPFKVVDEVRDIRVLLAQLDQEFVGFRDITEERKRQIKAHYEKYGHLPTRGENKILEGYIKSFRYSLNKVQAPEAIKRREEMIAFLIPMGFDPYVRRESPEVRMRQLEEFCEKHHRLPSKSEKELYNFMKHCVKRKKGEYHDKCCELRERYKKDYASILVRDIQNYLSNHNNEIDNNDNEWKNIRVRIHSAIRSDFFSDVHDYLNKFIEERGIKFHNTARRKGFFEQRMKEINDFFEEHGRFPSDGEVCYSPFISLKRHRVKFVTKEEFEIFDKWYDERIEISKKKVMEQRIANNKKNSYAKKFENWKTSVLALGRTLNSKEQGWFFQKGTLQKEGKNLTDENWKEFKELYDKYVVFYEEDIKQKHIEANSRTGRERLKKRYEELALFCEDKQRLPFNKVKSEKGLYEFYKSFFNKKKSNADKEILDKVIALVNKYQEATDSEISKGRSEYAKANNHFWEYSNQKK